MNPIRIAEQFGPTLQGEGRFTGATSHFIRTSGCNLRCDWCDTKFASWKPEGDWRKWEDVYESAVSDGSRHIVVTGGEPMLFPEQVAALTSAFRMVGRVVTVETAGTIYDARVKPDLWSVSPKLASAVPRHEPERSTHLRSLRPEATPLFMGHEADGTDVQYKFVVVTEEDLKEVKQFQEKYSIPSEKMFLMPEGVTSEECLLRARWVADLCKSNGYNLCVRLHALLWGARRGV